MVPVKEEFSILLPLMGFGLLCGRSTRESTPCSLIKDPDTIQTPGSTTRATTSSAKANGNIQSQSRRHIPTSHEMDEFFTHVESEQQKQFIDKYVVC